MSLDFCGSALVAYSDTVIRDRLALALRRAAGNAPRPAKWLARIINRTPQAAQNLLNADSSPSVETLAIMCREFDAVWIEWQKICQREPGDAEAMLARFTEILRERKRVP